MKIIISPTKKMKDSVEGYDAIHTPLLLEDTKRLYTVLSKMSVEELQACFKCNRSIAMLNYDRFQRMDLEHAYIPALFAYEGLAFQYMAPTVFDYEELAYVEEHLRILSGFYGILRCNDAVSLYRLEMQAKLEVEGYSDLYEFWGDRIARELFADEDVVLNLASEEYSKAVLPYKGACRVIQCCFVKNSNGKLVTRATEAKMMRGELVRYMAVHKVKDLEEIKNFSARGYHFREELSSEDTWFFVFEEENGREL
ncbi:MAG: peroxide stress protein YaaA [Erysipelotrichales bacterium]|nr:peroxide stress protein YaaA [Erysipelotrichales bacterium]